MVPDEFRETKINYLQPTELLYSHDGATPNKGVVLDAADYCDDLYKTCLKAAWVTLFFLSYLERDDQDLLSGEPRELRQDSI